MIKYLKQNLIDFLKLKQNCTDIKKRKKEGNYSIVDLIFYPIVKST